MYNESSVVLNYLRKKICNPKFLILCLFAIIAGLLVKPLNRKNAEFFSTLEKAIQYDEDRDLESGLGSNGILFIIAHPDDEVMFFTPTITRINEYIASKSESGEFDVKIHLLVFCNGSFYGKGELREESLKKVAEHLGVTVHLVNESDIKDGHSPWPLDKISSIILNYVYDNNIKAIFTFDKDGVSSHPNHKSIYQSVENIRVELQDLFIYNLKTLSLLRKYSSIFSLLIAVIQDNIIIYNLSSFYILKYIIL